MMEVVLGVSVGVPLSCGSWVAIQGEITRHTSKTIHSVMRKQYTKCYSILRNVIEGALP